MGCWKGHDGPVLSSIIVPSRLVGEGEAGGRFDLISGASDNNIKVRHVEDLAVLFVI